MWRMRSVRCAGSQITLIGIFIFIKFFQLHYMVDWQCITFITHNVYRYASTGNLVSTTSVGIGPSGSPIIGGQSIMAGMCIKQKYILHDFNRSKISQKCSSLIKCGPLSGASNPFVTGCLLNTENVASSLGNLSGMLIDDRDRSSFDKEFECSVCLDEMRPPTKIFQCRNGHVMCEACKNHTEVATCPTCR